MVLPSIPFLLPAYVLEEECRIPAYVLEEKHGILAYVLEENRVIPAYVLENCTDNTERLSRRNTD